MSAFSICVQTPAAALNSASVEANGRCVSSHAAQRVAPQQRSSAARASSIDSALRTACGSAARVPHSRSRLTPPSGKMFRRTCVTAPCARCSVVKKCRCVGRQLHLGQQRHPRRAGDQVGDPRARRVDALERAAIRVVALEVVGVDLDRVERAAGAEADQDPVVAGRALAPRLPAAAHVLGPARQEQVVHRAEEGVGAGEGEPAVAHRREIDAAFDGVRARLAIERRRRPLGGDAAEDAEARDAAVGEDVQADVRDRRARRRREQVLRVGPHAASAPAARSTRMACSAASGVPRGACTPSIDANAGLLPTKKWVSTSKPTHRRPARRAPGRTSRSRGRACGGSPSRPSTCRGR